MGKWGDGSLHGRRKGEVMGKWEKMQVGDRKVGNNMRERRKEQLGSFMGFGELGLGHGLGKCKSGEMSSGLL